MWGKLMECVYIETINENGELCEVYFPRGLYVTIEIPDKANAEIDLTEEIEEIVTKINQGGKTK